MDSGTRFAGRRTRLPEHDACNRRAFLARLAFLSASFALVPADAAACMRPRRQMHPEPRPGVDASRVLAAPEVPDDLVELYDRIREIPHIVDGIGCRCGCAELSEIYSLLSCYEESGMALHCHICQGEGRLAYRLHREGRTLDEIRDAIDRRTW